MIEEVMKLDDIVKSDPAAVAALARHGVHDLELLQVDPWSTGTLPIDGVSPGRRVIRASAYLREFAEDNGYAHPVGNLVFAIDCNEGSVVAIDDGPPIPLPPESGNYDVGSVARSARTCAPWRSLRARARRSRSPETSSTGSGGACRRTSTPSRAW